MGHAETFCGRLKGKDYIPEYGNHVLTEKEFLIDFAETAAKVKRGEIFSQAMVLFPDEAGKAITDIFLSASKEAKRTIVVDAYSRLALSNRVTAIASLNPFDRKALIQRLEKYDKLKMDLIRSGVTYEEINHPKGIGSIKHVFPFLGTNHTKGTYAFDEDTGKAVFYLHTSNHEGTSRINMVLKYEGKAALALRDIYKEMHENPPKTDYTKQLDEDTWVYADAGIPGKSIILDKAVELITNASKNVLTVTLMYPEGKFAKALQAKYNQWQAAGTDGKEMQVITTEFAAEIPVVTIGGTFYVVNKIAEMQAKLHGYNFPVIADKKRWSHAKCLIIDGKWLFIGSHNYASSGVRAGTREWQLLTKDPILVKEAEVMFRDYQELAQRNTGRTSC